MVIRGPSAPRSYHVAASVLLPDASYAHMTPAVRDRIRLQEATRPYIERYWQRWVGEHVRHTIGLTSHKIHDLLMGAI